MLKIYDIHWNHFWLVSLKGMDLARNICTKNYSQLFLTVYLLISTHSSCQPVSRCAWTAKSPKMMLVLTISTFFPSMHQCAFLFKYLHWNYSCWTEQQWSPNYQIPGPILSILTFDFNNMPKSLVLSSSRLTIFIASSAIWKHHVCHILVY